MKETIQKTRDYLDYIEEHYDNVQKAWELIKIKCKDMCFITDDYCYNEIDVAVKNHDMSKLSKEEFVQYRMHFFPVNSLEKENSNFESAWENHKNKNSHHWQNWVLGDLNDPYCELFVVHNIIDWVAMGFKFGDTAKSYYEKNKGKIAFPEWAVNFMYEIFEKIY